MQQYSKIKVIGHGLLGAIMGSIGGSIMGFFGGFAIPTSVRCMYNNLDEHIEKVFGEKAPEWNDGKPLSINQRVESAVYNVVRIPTRLAGHGALMYVALENLVEGKAFTDFDQTSIVLAANAASILYEAGRAIYQAGKKTQVSQTI